MAALAKPSVAHATVPGMSALLHSIPLAANVASALRPRIPVGPIRVPSAAVRPASVYIPSSVNAQALMQAARNASTSGGGVAPRLPIRPGFVPAKSIAIPNLQSFDIGKDSVSKTDPLAVNLSANIAQALTAPRPTTRPLTLPMGFDPSEMQVAVPDVMWPDVQFPQPTGGNTSGSGSSAGTSSDKAGAAMPPIALYVGVAAAVGLGLYLVMGRH